jgi:8-oxo-dGTP diphosphatase
MKDYVCGFLFNEARDRVVLIKKARPEWQAGRLNGVGGKVEPGESSDEAMRREFIEEAGVDVSGWELTVVVNGSSNAHLRGAPEAEWRVNFYRAFVPDNVLNAVRTMTDESVNTYMLSVMDYAPVNPNLKWIVPLCVNPCAELPICVADARSEVP